MLQRKNLCLQKLIPTQSHKREMDQMRQASHLIGHLMRQLETQFSF